MANEMFGPEYFARNMFFREAEGAPTGQELGPLMGGFGGSPEQLQQLLQHPAMQQRLGQLGIPPFDPNLVRQSPFFSNQFMQGHPGVGGFLNRGMASMAATPEAPMVSGLGSGLSRFAQGAMGGPELLRQYQIRQMMTPFHAAGMAMPMMVEERRRQLLQSLQDYMKYHEEMGRTEEDRRQAADQAKQQYEM